MHVVFAAFNTYKTTLYLIVHCRKLPSLLTPCSESTAHFEVPYPPLAAPTLFPFLPTIICKYYDTDDINMPESSSVGHRYLKYTYFGLLLYSILGMVNKQEHLWIWRILVLGMRSILFLVMGYFRHRNKVTRYTVYVYPCRWGTQIPEAVVYSFPERKVYSPLNGVSFVPGCGVSLFLELGHFNTAGVYSSWSWWIFIPAAECIEIVLT